MCVVAKRVKYASVNPSGNPWKITFELSTKPGHGQPKLLRRLGMIGHGPAATTIPDS